MSEMRGLMDLMSNTCRRLEWVWDDVIRERSEHTSGVWRPPTDVYESRELIVIKMEAAGLKPGDAEVLVENDVVTIRGARLDRCSLAKLAFHQAEVRYGRFERRLRISVPFDADRIRAELADGFLEVIVPKADPPSRRVVKVSLTV